MSRRDDFLRWVLSREGRPYLWGGCGDSLWTPEGVVASPYPGWDCIHLVTDGMHQVGGPDYRWTWNTDAAWLALRPVATPRAGDLAFWAPARPSSQDDVCHVEVVTGPGVVLAGAWRTIGAAGGDSTTRTLERATSQAARVRRRESHLARSHFAGFRALPFP